MASRSMTLGVERLSSKTVQARARVRFDWVTFLCAGMGLGCTLDPEQTLEPPPVPAEDVTKVLPEPEPVPEPEPEPPPPPVPQPMEVISRASWGAEPAKDGCEAHEITKLSVHHTASVAVEGVGAPHRLRGYQRYHQQQGWMDLAYHFMVDLEGKAYQGRDWKCRGDTFTGYDPTGHFLVVLDGNFEEQEPTEAQVRTAAMLLAWASENFNVEPSELQGHRDLAATACPGEHVYTKITSGALAAQVDAIRSVGPVVLE